MSLTVCLQKCYELTDAAQKLCRDNCYDDNIKEALKAQSARSMQTLNVGAHLIIGSWLAIAIVYAAGCYFTKIKGVETDLLTKQRKNSMHDYSNEIDQLQKDKNHFHKSLWVIAALVGMHLTLQVSHELSKSLR